MEAGSPGPEVAAERWELALSVSGVGSFDWDLRTGVLVWDERLCRLFGMDTEDFDNRIETFYAGVHPADRERVRELIDEAIKTRGGYHAEYRVITPAGESRWVDARGRVLADAEGEPQRLIGVASDFTDRYESWRRQQDAERAESARARLINTVTGALAEALTLKEVTGVLIETMRPAVGASGVGVVLVEGQRLRAADAIGFEPHVLAEFDGVLLSGSQPIVECIHTRTPLFAGNIAAFAAHWPGRAEGAGAAWAYLPMVAGGRTVGGLAVRWAENQPFTSDDRTLLVALGGLAAQSIERARLYDSEHELAAGLQRVMLPRRTAGIPGIATACRYLPSGAGLQVGGDWYDVITLPSGKLGLVVGDVEGHTAHAAAVMGQLRIAVRAYASEGHRPEQVLARTNRLLVELETRLLATCCYVTLDPETGAGEVVRAGHPPPLLVRADGSVEVIEAFGGLILGVQGGDYRSTPIQLGPDDALILITDGLIEAPGMSIDEGIAALVERAADGAGEPPEQLADRIIAPLDPAGRRFDDVAVLVAGREQRGEQRTDEARHAVNQNSPGAIGRSRAFVARTLQGWGLDAEVVERAVLCASELVTNAVRHGEGVVELVVSRYPDRIRIAVEDDSSTPPHPVQTRVTSTGGRGLDVVARLALDWGSAPRGTGKVVWAEFSLL